jgi:hypothetical protein
LRLDSSLALLLSAVMAAPSPILAQQAGAVAPAPVAQAAPAQPQPTELKVVVIEGEGAQNNVKSRTGINPVVEIRDQADKPVSGVEVVFQLPAAGPGGVFNGWMRTQTVRTNEKGQAGTNGFAPNDQEGRFNIKVTAEVGTTAGSAVIAQSNVKFRGSDSTIDGGKSHWWKWAIGVGAVAVVIGVVAATRGGGGTTTSAQGTPTAVTVTPGAISVGGPR